MSIKSLTEEVVATGKAKRGEYDPSPDSWTTKVYNWHFDRKNSAATRPKQENFCHYWRIVLIWSWLSFIGTSLVIGLEKVASPVYHFFADDPNSKTRRALRATGKGIKRGFQSRTAVWIWRGFVILWFVALALGAAYLAYIALRDVYADGGWLMVWLWSTAIVGTVVLSAAALATGAAGLKWAVETVKDAKRRRREAERRRLLAQIESGELTWEQVHGSVKAPNKVAEAVKAFFRGVKDFFVLIAQIVRVNKWKICPMVNVPGAPEPVSASFKYEDDYGDPFDYRY